VNKRTYIKSSATQAIEAQNIISCGFSIWR